MPKKGSLFERLKSGLEAGIAHERGERKLRVFELELPDPPGPYGPQDVQQLRESLRLSQAAFARLLYVSPRTVQSWEAGRRAPSHAAARLLQLIENPGLLQAFRPRAASKARRRSELKA